jgi:hypothetical protein
MRNLFKWKALVALAAMLLPAVAFAQSSIFGDIPATDVSVHQLLSKIFGGLIGSGGGDPLEVLLRTFNGGVLTIGGILVFYTLVAGTMSTAHDGEMLGKRWSSLWIPIRTTLGAAAIMPTMGLQGGYCVIQAIVMWLALQGVGMANSMWSEFLGSDSLIEDAFYNPPGVSRQIRETFNDMYMSNVCTAAMRETQKYAQVLADNFNAPLIGAEVTNLPGGGFAYGPMGALCGQVLMGTNPGSADSARTVPVLGDSPATSAAFVDSNAIAESLRSVHRSNIAAAQAQLKVLADQTVANTLSPETFNSTMNSLVQNYQTQLRDTAHSTYTAQRANLNGKLVKGMVDDGWAMAGMYYVAVVRAQDEITRAITQTPATASGELWGTGNVVTDAATQGGAFGVAKNFLGNAFVNSSGRDEYLNRGRAMIKQGNATNLSQVETIADQATGDSWVMKVVSWFMNDDMTFFGNQQFAQQGQNPIIMAKNLGENMTAGAWTALAIGGSVLALSGADILGTGIGDWATVFTPVLFALFAMFVVPGATLSTYVPMIPYILWVGVIIGWVILVVEAVIASPIWAVAHMAPDGDGVVGRGGQGYMLVLSLTLRPPLMILGLACSISLMKPIGYFVNSTFLGAFAMGVNPGPLAITQAIAGCVLYAVVMVGVVHRVFTLIHLVPDRILRWIGGGGNELGDQAGSLEQSSAGKTLQAMHSTQQIGNLSQGALQGSRDLSRKKADAAHAGAIRGEETRSRMAQQEANVADNAYRAGLTAETSSSRAEDNPSVESYNQAALDNEVARNSQLGEGENKLDHYMQQSGAEGGLPGGLNQLRSMPMAQRQEMAQNMAETNPQMARAIQFANNLDQARSEQRSNPSGNAMASFINSQAASVSANGASGSAVWEVSAAQSKKFEDKRQQFVQGPPPPPGGGDQPT